MKFFSIVSHEAWGSIAEAVATGEPVTATFSLVSTYGGCLDIAVDGQPHPVQLTIRRDGTWSAYYNIEEKP